MFLFGSLNVFAQEQELDKFPFPVGGIEQIAENIVYPSSAKENKVQGDVIIKAVINEEGDVVRAEVIKSLDKECDNAASEAVKKTRFTPGIKDGKATECEIDIPVRFKLE
jgi:TonB family protein